MRFDENPFTCHCEHASAKKETKRQGFQISHFYWLFLSDVMAVKGLTILFSIILRSYVPSFMTMISSNSVALAGVSGAL